VATPGWNLSDGAGGYQWNAPKTFGDTAYFWTQYHDAPHRVISEINHERDGLLLGRYNHTNGDRRRWPVEYRNLALTDIDDTNAGHATNPTIWDMFGAKIFFYYPDSSVANGGARYKVRWISPDVYQPTYQRGGLYIVKFIVEELEDLT
tara:strand:+ start:5437 stop:5883 length:447 start_codon:yes stop_codon:yes gene_type:complete